MTRERYEELLKKLDEIDEVAWDKVNKEKEYPTTADHHLVSTASTIIDGGERLTKLAAKVGSTPSELKEYLNMFFIEHVCDEIESE